MKAEWWGRRVIHVGHGDSRNDSGSEQNGEKCFEHRRDTTRLKLERITLAPLLSIGCRDTSGSQEATVIPAKDERASEQNSHS